ncbi:MAG TPA: DUF1003 domain-containing protein [Acidobacteriota bacterium]
MSSRFTRRLKRIHGYQAKHNLRKTGAERLADKVTDFTGGVPFLVINGLWFLIWIVINLNIIPSVKAFDPFPFSLLTMIVSLEAIFLSIFVLISQNRQSKIADLRQEIDLQINMIAEEEITKIMQMLAAIYKRVGHKEEKDPEILEMMKPLNIDEIEERLEKEYDEVKKESK